LLRRLRPNVWETLVKPGKRIRPGTRIEIIKESTTGDMQNLIITAEAIQVEEGGTRIVQFSDETLLPELGEIPLPPYIHVPLKDPGRYQTIYANTAGSVAAPTAGLHFTPELLEQIKAKGVRCLFTTLHVGLDTFRPVREENPIEHPIHKEYGIVSRKVASELSRARSKGQRVICVGTTTVRLVEAVAQASRSTDIKPFEGWVDLFIVPGYQFQVVDALITNFHLPRSTLLMLVTAFAGKELIGKAYQEAIKEKYRFYSFGDAMLIF
jgi:S-adenosylmethionine:tRNA ribosyltransferase-isomerase